MEVNSQDIGILGRAVFGTGQGLDFQGEGILALRRDTGGLFEFDLGSRSEGRASLSALGPNGLATFRRRVAESADRQYDLLGILRVCKDASRRPGFAGACVAVTADQGGSISSVKTWDIIFDEADKMMQSVETCIDKDTQSFLFPKHPLFENTRQVQRAPLRLANAQTQLLHWDLDDEDDISRYFERFRSLCFHLGERVPTVICSTSRVSNAIPLSDERFDGMVRAFRDARGSFAVPSVEERGQNAAPLVESAHHKKADLETPAYAAAPQSQKDTASLLDRITKLEDDYQYLQRQVQALRHQGKLVDHPDEPTGWFREIAEHKRLWVNVGLSILSIPILVLLVVLALWFFQAISS